ncbi:MAG: zeta toxin family protein [Candidatus Niyogibacteria bacterium]|nr:zeta toxin family protein [Candidatus Niyogibacteria bacterium]
MNEAEHDQSEVAFRWIKLNHNLIINQFAGGAEYVTDDQPTTLFMAGSPGAGKTEISKRFIDRFKQKPIRIDADEIRTVCINYAGANAHIFQKAATKGVNILYDYALHHNINVILDGTFAYAESLKNIERSLNRGRKIEILFVYQNPLQAWEFTKKREAIEHRQVSKEVFIDAFFKSRENVNKAKEYFGNNIELNIIIKDFEKDLEKLEINVQNIDYYIKAEYTRENLDKLIS